MNDIVFHFKVLYKFKNAPQIIKSDYVCSDLKELKEALKGEGVTRDTVDYLYAHQRSVGAGSDNEVQEVIAWDSKMAPHVETERPSAIIIPLPTHKKNTTPEPPPVKVEPKVEDKRPVIRSTFFKAVQA